MEGQDSAKRTMPAGGTTAVTPASAMDYLQNTINELREVTECIYTVLIRTHNVAYGEYQDGPQTAEDESDVEPGKVHDFRRQVRAITEGTRLTLRVAESLESHG